MNITDLIAMRDICRRTRELMDYIGPHVVSGVTTQQLNDLCHEYTVTVLDSESAPLGYHGFPRSICTSVNRVVCHGIPDDTPLRSGDIVNVDVTLKRRYGGVYHYGDMSRMYQIGTVHPRHRYLCEVTQRALNCAIQVVKPGVPFSAVGKTIDRIARSEGFSVVQDFCGHGIGTEFHSAPQILHYDNDLPGVFEPGMTFTIEPMLNERGHKTRVLADGWTAVTRDGGYSAQWEHTLLVTDTGVEVLTA